MLDHSCHAQRHSHVELGHDLYETPAVAVEALLRVLALPSGAIWEPACGRGAIANVLRMTARQVFYQLVARGVIEKTEDEYQRTVIRLMTEMRLDGYLPFDWVVDESRRVRIMRTYNSIEHALEETAKFYRRSALEQSDDYVEIWVEKDALAGVMWDVTSDYDVPLMVSRGMPSLTFLHGSALAIRRAEERGKTSYIYQFGDHDPSGVLIPKAIERRLDEICQDLDCEPPYVERIALTKEQIEEHNLPTRPTKRDGNRHAHGSVGDSVELDALPPSTLRAIVRAVIEQHVSPEATQALRVAQDSERDLLRAWRVRALGEDRVQAILDEAFADADFRPLHAEVA